MANDVATLQRVNEGGECASADEACELASEIGYDSPDDFRDALIGSLAPARDLAQQHGMLYTLKYLAAAALAAEIEASDAYYLREADELLKRQSKGS